MNSTSLLADLEEFVTNHRPHGSLTADATEAARNSYHLSVFGRWVTPDDAELDLLRAARLN